MNGEDLIQQIMDAVTPAVIEYPKGLVIHYQDADDIIERKVGAILLRGEYELLAEAFTLLLKERIRRIRPHPLGR